MRFAVNKSQIGSSLIESLVSFVVLSVGLTAWSGVQVNATMARFEGQQRTQATILAESMASQMRANAGSLQEYDGFVAGIGVDAPVLISCVNEPSCTPKMLAQYDKWLWHQELIGASTNPLVTRVLRNGNGLYDARGCSFVTDSRVRIVVAWRSQLEQRKQLQKADLYDERCTITNAGTQTHMRQLVLDTYIASPPNS